MCQRRVARSDKKLLDAVLHGLDLALQVAAVAGSHGAADDGPGHAAGAAEGDLRGNEHVRHVLVLAEKGEVEKNLQRLRIGSEHDELSDAAVQGLGGLVGTLQGEGGFQI